MLRVQLPILVLSCSAAVAQSTFVVPPSYAQNPGNSLEQQVFGFDQSRYVQFVDKAELTGLNTGAGLKELRYRREENRLDQIYSSYEPMKRSTTTALPNWEIRVGNFTGNYDQLSTTYESAANGVAMTTVFAAQLNLTTHCPQLAPPPNPQTPAPFEMKFPFNIATVTYGGAGLCVSHKVYGTRNASHIYFVDAIQSQPANGGDVSLISPTTLGCPPGFNRVRGSAPNPGAGDVQLHLFGGPAQVPAMAFLGVGPTTVDLSFMGLSPCNLYTDLSAPLPASTDFAGIASLSIPVPGLAAYTGVVLYNQWIIADDRISQHTPLAFSDGVRITIGSTVGAGHVRMTVISALGSQSRSTYGYIRPNQGAVFQLVY